MVDRNALGQFVKGSKYTEIEKIESSKRAKELGFGLWMEGKKLSESHKSNISKRMKSKNYNGSSHHLYKGDKIGYYGLHKWVVLQKGTPKECKHCGVKDARIYDWANISYSYKREINDWIRLCRKCHIKFDKKGTF